MLGWLKAKVGLVFSVGKSKGYRRQQLVWSLPRLEGFLRPVGRHFYPIRPLRKYLGEGRPPKLQWKASHPSTIRRFKAEVTCSRGHAITLRDHTVEADGRVVPSIVCKTPGCDFHEVVRLDGWSAGRVPAKLAAA